MKIFQSDFFVILFILHPMPLLVSSIERKDAVRLVTSTKHPIGNPSQAYNFGFRGCCR